MDQPVQPPVASPSLPEGNGCDAQPSGRAETIDTIAASMGRLRRMMGRRFLSRLALSRLGQGHGLELSHVDVITLVARAGEEEPVTVGTVADHLRIDPSRASRVVADLVKGGSLRREACQDDARRTLVRLTDQGEALARHFEAVRREVIGRSLEGWSDGALAAFAPLFARYIADLEEGLPNADR